MNSQEIPISIINSEYPTIIPSNVRVRILHFLINSATELRVSPIVKYTALSLFADRFLKSPVLSARKPILVLECDTKNWLLQPLKESNLQLFALMSLWISSKIHDTCPLSVKSLKYLGDMVIIDQHFTARDFIEAELVFMKVLGFRIGAANIAFIFLEELLFQFRELARIGEVLDFNVCMDIMDLLYESEETSVLYSSPCSLAASILVASYVLTVPKQRWEFPILPWVRFVTSYREDDVGEVVRRILQHILTPTRTRCVKTKSFGLKAEIGKEDWF